MTGIDIVGLRDYDIKCSGNCIHFNFSDISPSKVTRNSSDSESQSDTESDDRSQNSEDRDKSSLEGSLSESESESMTSDSPSDTESNTERQIQPVDSNDSDDEKTKELKKQSRYERRKNQRAAEKAEKRPPKQINLTTGITPRPLTKLDHGSVRDWAAHLIMLRASGNHANAYSLIDVKIREMIGIKMAAYEIPDNPKKKWITEKDLLAYRFWTDTRLTRRLLQLYPDERENAADRESV
eukprot:gene26023-32551_t